ncbi:MAG: class I SAM-dependent methyltransferase [Vicinamibacterales bacterium]
MSQPAKAILKAVLPELVVCRLKELRDRLRAVRAVWSWPPSDLYVRLYRRHIRHLSDEDIVGDAKLFDLIGRIELGVLLAEGLRPTDTLVDLGCGTGRLAVHVIPYLAGGRYVGIEILDSILDKAKARVARCSVPPSPPCLVEWVRQTTDVFALPDGSADVVCAFSVFTHMEHEDAYRYLKDARRITRTGGKFLFSCLPMKHQAVYDIFLASARDDLAHRWSKVRNVTTSEDLMESICVLAGWTPVRWYAGNACNIPLPGSGELAALGQSVCVLEARGRA